MHYVDEGPHDGEVILCLHGEPTWGYLFRHLIPALSETHRVVVPDHMGFGKSETPADRSYWLQDHIDNLEAFVLALGLTDITLVMHDFGGPVGMGLAARHPDRIAASSRPTDRRHSARRIFSIVSQQMRAYHHGSSGSPARMQTARWSPCCSISASIS
nr:alpha/beta fold hydrolase [Rhizobium sp. RCAM05973]